MMRKGKGKNTTGGKLLPNSWRIVSSCIKTISTNASTVVRSAVTAAISSSADHHKDQVSWAGFDKLELRPSVVKHVLLVGYVNGFQVIDVEDASNFSELVSKRDGPITFLQILPTPLEYDVEEEISSLHPILLVVAVDEDSCQGPGHFHTADSQSCNSISPSNTVRFYSFRSNCYVKVISFPSPVLMVRSSPRIIAVGLKSQIYCIDNLTLEKRYNVTTYPVPQFEGQGQVVNTGYGPMAVGPRWLAYAPENPYDSITGHLNSKSFPGVSPCMSPGYGSLIAHYAMESGKQFATGIMNLGDMGYKTLSKYCPDFLPDVAGSPAWNFGKPTAQIMEKAGMVVIEDVLSTAVVSQFRAHTSPISALCFDPSGTILVTASVHGNNINVFRIMPSPGHGGENCYNWNSSHVHLYKLYRGVTAAIIRDICFSHCSRQVLEAYEMSGGGGGGRGRGRGGRFFWVRNDKVAQGKVKGIVLLFAWVSIQERDLKDYTDLYSFLGWNSLVCLADFLNPFIPDRAASLAFSILVELVQDLRLRPCPLVLVSLSGGSQACMYKVFQIIDGECEVQLSLEDNELVRNCISGQIYDSDPVDFTSDLGARFALHHTVQKLPGSAKLASLIAKGITSSLDALLLTRFSSQSTDYWQTIHSSASLGAPFLILCSENDDFAPYPSVRNFSLRLQEVGANVKVVKWKNSTDAGHYKSYPIQYRAAISKLLEESLSTFIHKIQRLGERTGMEGMHDGISVIICDLQNAAINSNQSLRRIALGPSDHFFLPSSKECQSSGDSRSSQEERKEKSQSCSNPRISAHSVLGQILFDACVPKNIEEGWDIKFSGSLNGKPYASARWRSPLNPIKFIRRSRL